MGGRKLGNNQKTKFEQGQSAPKKYSCNSEIHNYVQQKNRAWVELPNPSPLKSNGPSLYWVIVIIAVLLK